MLVLRGTMNTIFGLFLTFLLFGIAYSIKKAIARKQGEASNLSFWHEFRWFVFPNKKVWLVWIAIMAILIGIVILGIAFGIK